MEAAAPAAGRARLVAIALLSCQQYLAIAFVYGAIPAVLRQAGAPLPLLGLFGLVFFAFTVNFLWAPWVDRWRLTPLGRVRSWLLLTQAGAAAATLWMALQAPRAEAGTALLLGGAVLATLCATQRIATLGYIALALAPEQRARGAGWQGWGMALGNLIGGALCLLLIERIGWRAAVCALAATMALFALALPWLREPQAPPPRQPGWRVLAAGLARPAYWRAVALVAPAGFGSAVAFSMMTPRLVDLGVGLGNIGLAVTGAQLLAFSLAAPPVARWIDARGAAAAIGRLAALLALLFALAALASPAGRGAALATVVLVALALSLQHVAFNAHFYGVARAHSAATDMSLLSAALSLAALAGFAASGFIAERFGYPVTLATAAAGYALTALAAWRRNASR